MMYFVYDEFNKCISSIVQYTASFYYYRKVFLTEIANFSKLNIFMLIALAL